LKDYIDESYKDVEKTVFTPDKLDEDIERVCKKKYSEISLRIRRGIIRSIIYIFFTKATLALMIEIPYELLSAKSVNYLTLVINILFPPTLMFLMGTTIKKPSDENTKRIIKIIKSFVYTDDDVEKVPFSLERKKIGSIISRVFLAFYIFLFFLIFGSISLILIIWI
jgi:hypothetical protein